VDGEGKRRRAYAIPHQQQHQQHQAHGWNEAGETTGCHTGDLLSCPPMSSIRGQLTGVWGAGDGCLGACDGCCGGR
jgi:hypothetical protein